MSHLEATHVKGRGCGSGGHCYRSQTYFLHSVLFPHLPYLKLRLKPLWMEKFQMDSVLLYLFPKDPGKQRGTSADPPGSKWSLSNAYFHFWQHKLEIWVCMLLLSCSVVSNSLRPHGPQHARLPCPSPSPGACSNSCPLSPWYYPTISSSVVPFSSCLPSFPASGNFRHTFLGVYGS